MNNDLIRRDALSKKICDKECDVPKFETEVELNAFLLGLNAKQIAVMECLSDMPTAYDVDKVVERLEELMKAECEEDFDEEYENGISVGKYRAYTEAVEIVKSGGI